MMEGRGPRILSAVVGVMLAGCESAPAYLDRNDARLGAEGLTEQLVREAASISHLLGLGQVAVILALLVSGWLATRLVHAGVLMAWRMGTDPKRRLGPVRTALNVAISGGVAYLLLRRVLVAAPVTTLAAIALAASAAMLVFAHPIQNVWAGFVLSFRRRLREGDRVTVGDQSGIVRDIGITQLHLRSADGAALYVPNRVVLRECYRVEQAKNTVPVRVRVEANVSEWKPEHVRAVRRSALLSPFRAAGTPIDVEVTPEGAQVVIQVWSERAAREARLQLEARLRDQLRDATSVPQGG